MVFWLCGPPLAGGAASARGAAAETAPAKPAGVQPAEPEADPVAPFFWLLGSWLEERPGRRIEEGWAQNETGALIGVNRVYRGDEVVFFEYLRIETGEDGEIYFQASPMGREPTKFKLIERGESRAVFENPDHDYPQRILYWLEADGTLRARIEGVDAGEAKSGDWSYLPATESPPGLQ